MSVLVKDDGTQDSGEGQWLDSHTRLRPERPGDETFRFALFCQTRPPALAALLPIMRQQFAAQGAGYRAQYPDARYDIVEWRGAAAGRLVTDRAAEVVRVVDVAVASGVRGHGIGTTVLRAVIAAALADGAAVELAVACGNEGAIRLYRRLGFTPYLANAVQIEMRLG